MTEALLKNNLYTLFWNGRPKKNLDNNRNTKSSFVSFARYVHCIPFFCMLETIVCSSETTLDSVPIDIVELNDIKINDNEKELIDTLKKFCENRGIWGDQEVVPRIAGGWVRDKLSGRESNDIDIAVDTMSGFDFAQKFLKADLIKCNQPKIIQANLEMSKDIEVTTMYIGNLPVEFVQLRSGTEEAEKLPSACNDAKRRDFTINSLFYNIMTGEIEDYTNGCKDIKRKILRTPVPSLETFLICPLRVLRAMRFAVHYNLTVDDQIYHAMQNSAVKRKLNESIANERIGTEIQKITGHKNGYIGMLMLVKYGLLETVFKASNCKAKKPKEKEVSVYVHIDDPVGDKSRHEISHQFAEKLAAVDVKKYKIDKSLFNLYICLLHYKGLKIEKRFVNSAIVGDKLKWTLLMEKKIQNIETNIEKHNIIPEEEYDIIKMIKDMNDDWLDILYLQYLFTGDEKWKDTIDKVIAKGYNDTLKIKSIKDGNALKVIFEVAQTELSKYMECFVIYQVIYGTDDEDKLIDCVKKHLKENKQ